MTAPAICDVCHKEIDGNDYRLAGYDRATWRSLITHLGRGCWDRREELRAPGVQIVGKPDPAQPMMVQFVA